MNHPALLLGQSGVVGPGEAWYSNVQVLSDFLQVASKGCIFIRLRELVPCIRHPKSRKDERSEEKRVNSDLGLVLSGRVLQSACALIPSL